MTLMLFDMLPIRRTGFLLCYRCRCCIQSAILAALVCAVFSETNQREMVSVEWLSKESATQARLTRRRDHSMRECVTVMHAGSNEVVGVEFIQ
jgi:hypothetical protein